MLNKLSRKDIDLLKQVSNSNASKEALNEYLEAHHKAYSAWNVYLGAMKANEDCNVDTEELVDVKEHIIEYEGEKYKLVDRKARAGDVVIFKMERISTGTRSNTVYEVIYDSECRYGAYIDDYSWKMAVYGWETDVEVFVYEKIVNQKSTSRKKTNNQLRAEIIQRAKDFVEELRNGGMVVENKHSQYTVDVSFIVNARKKTVVALLRGVSTDKIRVKGIAKCHPDDVFNEHIGKAIALGRALNIDVSEFENAVQPSFEVGQTIEYVSFDGTSRAIQLINVDSERLWFVDSETEFNCFVRINRENGIPKIIDDTNAQYQETIQ